jgi:hypothetical protein
MSDSDSWRSYFDLAAKSSATLLASIYASGFLIVSVYEGQYGFALFDLFKPRIFSAGILFSVFLLMPILAASRVFRLFGLETATEQVRLRPEILWYRRLSFACQYYVLTVALAFAAGLLFENTVLPLSPRLFFVIYPSLLAPAIVFGWIVNKRPVIVLLVNIYILALSAAVIFFSMHRDFFWLTAWFYAVGIAFVIGYFKVTSPELRRTVKWERAFVNGVVFVVIFATVFYGKIRIWFGGGGPVAATITLSQKLPISDSLTTSVMILDETEFGFYVLTEGNRRAFFIPRSEVASVSFGNRKAESRGDSK